MAIQAAGGSGVPALVCRVWVARLRLLWRDLHAGAGNTHAGVLVSADRRRSADTSVWAQQAWAVEGGKGAGVGAGVAYAEEKSCSSAV